MRLWSLHPRYLDAKGLVALWREGLLAQAVLAGKTRGYRHHPQLARFLQTSTAEQYIAAYLRPVHAEAVRRGYHFDQAKIGGSEVVLPLSVTQGQLEFERAHLAGKLGQRAPCLLVQLEADERPQAHPLFQIVAGGIAGWEAVPVRHGVSTGTPASGARR